MADYYEHESEKIAELKLKINNLETTIKKMTQRMHNEKMEYSLFVTLIALVDNPDDDQVYKKAKKELKAYRNA